MSNINFTLLETARLLRQKTQKEVVEAIGISQASLSKAEHGLQELPIDIMSKLYDYYDLPETFFLRSDIGGLNQNALQGGNGAFGADGPGGDRDGALQQRLFAGKLHKGKTSVRIKEG